MDACETALPSSPLDADDGPDASKLDAFVAQHEAVFGSVQGSSEALEHSILSPHLRNNSSPGSSCRQHSASFSRALEVRHLSRQSPTNTDLLMQSFSRLPHANAEHCRDNLVMPAYRRVYQAHGPDSQTRSWLYNRLNHSQPDEGSTNELHAVDANELRFHPKQLERAMPVPPSSVYLASSIKLNGSDAHFSSPSNAALAQSALPFSDSLTIHDSENSTKILHPETIGQLLCSYMLHSIDDDGHLISFLRQFLSELDPETIAQHQIKAQSIFVKYLAPKNETAEQKAARADKAPFGQSTLTRKELAFLKLNHREDLCLGTAPSLYITNYVLTFGTTIEKPITIGETLTADLVLKNKKKLPLSCFFCHCPSNPKSYTVTVDPQRVDLKKNQSARITVSFTLHDYTPRVDDFLCIEVLGGARHFISLSVFSETKPQFGVLPEETDMEYLEGFGEFPKVLVHLQRLYRNLNGRRRVGIFRRAGHETRMKHFKLQLNRGIYSTEMDDYNSVANLIKIWFRELPVKIFDHIDAEALIHINAEDPEVCSQIMEEIPEPYRRLFKWLLCLMAEVAENQEENKMDPKNLAIVFSPNLYSSKADNPAKIIMITQKLSQLVCSLIKWFMENEMYLTLRSTHESRGESGLVDAEYVEEAATQDAVVGIEDVVQVAHQVMLEEEVPAAPRTEEEDAHFEPGALEQQWEDEDGAYAGTPSSPPPAAPCSEGEESVDSAVDEEGDREFEKYIYESTTSEEVTSSDDDR